MQRLKVLASLLALALLCTAGAASAQVDTGTANFTRYVAFGDSLTAGFSSAALVRTFQNNSYPVLIYRQATGKTTGFEQPLVSEPGFSSTPHFGILRLASLVPSVVIAPTPGDAAPLNLTLPRPYDNIAVPGARLHDLLFTKFGGLHDLILRNDPRTPDQAFTQLQEGLSLQPTFATLWIGNNDVLAAATSGIVIEGVTLTPAAQFDAEFRQAAAAIASVGAKMAIANIPDVTSIPFVTTVSRFVTLPTGQTVTLVGPDGPLQAGDFVLLSASADIQTNGRGIPGVGAPLADSQVLSAAEVATIQDRVNHYNATITAVANERGAALVDSNAALRQLATTGVNIGGVTYRSSFLTGGIFSYDGVHPTAFGYAYLANLFIDAINAKFDGEIPPVDLYPFVFGTGKAADRFTEFVFTDAARRNLLLSLGVPKWIVDGQPAPSGKPHRPRRGGKG